MKQFCQKLSLTRPAENQSLAEFKAQLPVEVIKGNDNNPVVVTPESGEKADKRPTWIVAGERHNSYREGKATDALDFYVELGCEIVGVVVVDDGYQKEPFYKIKLPADGTVGICKDKESSASDHYMIHDQLGKIKATSNVRFGHGPLGNRVAVGYLIEEGYTRR